MESEISEIILFFEENNENPKLSALRKRFDEILANKEIKKPEKMAFLSKVSAKIKGFCCKKPDKAKDHCLEPLKKLIAKQKKAAFLSDSNEIRDSVQSFKEIAGEYAVFKAQRLYESLQRVNDDLGFKKR